MFGMGRSPAREASRRGWAIYVNGASADVQKVAGTMTLTSGIGEVLIDSAAHFQTGAHPVAVGDKVTTSAASKTVVSVDSDTQLTLSGSVLATEVATGANTTAEASKLIDALATFQTAGVAAGYMINNVDIQEWGVVTALDPVTPEIKLSLGSDLFPVVGGIGVGYTI
jgi:hypothetical protein